MKLVVLDEAIVELGEIVNHYEQESVGLGCEFFEEAHAVMQRIQLNPRQFAIYFRKYRLARVERFPYGVIFRIRRDHIRVVAFRHFSRAEEYWLGRERPK